MKPAIEILLVALLSSSCQVRPSQQNPWSFDRDAGVVIRKPRKTCLSIHNSSVLAGTGIQVINMSSPQSGPDDARIVRADESCFNSAGGDVDVSGYEIQLEKADAVTTPSIGILGFSGAFHKRGDLLAADLDGDGQEEFFRSCTSNEGVHFSIWSSQPLAGTPRWKQYYYLGYDVASTCAPKEMELQPGE
jgi:hypothetical protein